MDSNFTPAQSALLWSWRLLFSAVMSFLLLSILAGILHSDLLFMGGIGLAALLAVIGLFVRLIGTVQLRLLELIILVAWLGNLIGWSIRSVISLPKEYDDTRVILAVLLVAAALLWTAGGAAIGLRLAHATNCDAPLPRLKLMLTGLAAPLAIFAIMAGVALIFGALGSVPKSYVLFLAGLLSIVLGSCFMLHVFKLSQKARRVIQYSDV